MSCAEHQAQSVEGAVLWGGGSQNSTIAVKTKLRKEIAKLNYYTEQADELIEIGDAIEMESATNRVKVIHNEIIELTGKVEEMRPEQGESSRSVRQWKKRCER